MELLHNKLKRCVRDFYNLFNLYKQDRQNLLDFIRFSELQMEAVSVHKSFLKYKECYKDRDVVVIGSGPTLDKWRGGRNYVQIGVNGSFLSDNVDLDYLFIQDYDSKMLDQLHDKNIVSCKKFFGVHYMLPDVRPIPYCELDRFGAEQYFFYDSPQMIFPFDFTMDISSKPFITYGSTIFVALQFALYTHPRRLYIVGCDCSENHFSSHITNLHNKNNLNMQVVNSGWEKFAVFSNAMYSDVEIISVNPVGLRGLFKDEFD